VDEQARYGRDDELGIELLSARYVTHRFGLHAHDTYVIGVVVDGAARFACRGRTFLSPSGTIMVIEPEEPHTGGAAAAIGWAYRMLYVSPAVLRRVTAQMARPAATPSFGRHVIDDPAIATALVAAQRALERGASPLAKEALLVDALGRLIERHAGAPARGDTRSARAGIASRARAYLEENFASPITLGELADHAGTGPFSLVRAVKAELGLPPHAYLNQIRVRRAKALLAAGGDPARVATEVGFYDQSHLGRHFKRTVGVTPACYASLTKASRRATRASCDDRPR
jgi:AraC-like DNA-binding protein